MRSGSSTTSVLTTVVHFSLNFSFPFHAKSGVLSFFIDEPKLSLRIHRKMSPTTNKKNQKCEIGEDRISSLPDNVIHHILSLLPTGCAVRTLTLSAKWKRLWTGITNLYFSQELTNYNDTKFVDFVHQTMIRRENVAKNKFHLSCSVWHLDESLINAWVSYALTHNVAHIFLNVGCNVGDDYLVFPCAIFNCESLKLIVGDNCDYSEFDPALVCFSDEIIKRSGSISISWSRLRALQLTHIQFSFDQPINQVHFRLPVLKKLDLIDCFWLNVKIVTFDAPTLQSFAFHIIDEFDRIKYPKRNISQVPTLKADVEIKVDAPDLRSLHVVTDLTYKLSLCDLPSLCEAPFHIISYMYGSEIELRLSNVFEAISSVTVITLTDFAIYELWSANLTKKLLSLTHLKFLNVDVIDWCLHGGVLTDLFHYLPCVERLHFNKGLYTDGDFGYPENFGWTLQTLSQPILPKLESCFLGNGNDLGLVKFLLKNARALQKISISMEYQDPKKRLETTNQLEMLSRGLTCSIEIYEEFLDTIYKEEAGFGEVDERGWRLNNEEEFTVKSYYNRVASLHAEKALESHEIIHNFPQIKIWLNTIPHKVAFFSWMTYLNRIQTVDKLLPKGVAVNDECVFCHAVGENASHFLVLCSVIRDIWNFFFSWFDVNWVPPVDVKEALTKQLIKWPLSRKGQWIVNHLPRAITWVVWNERNKRIFDLKSKPVHAIIMSIKEILFDWAKGNGAFHDITYGDFICNWSSVIS